MNTNTSTVVNGVDVDQLIATVGLIQQNPDLARFQFRSTTSWIQGGLSRTEIQGFRGAGQEDRSREEPFVLEGDEPPVLLGTNLAPNAVEVVLHALASCLSVGVVYNAAAQGIEIDELTFEIEGELDLQGFLGLVRDVRPGYEGIRVRCHLRSSAPQEKIDDLLAYVRRTSPVLDILTNPVPVEITVN